MKNERLTRAKEQGFDVDTIWYHVSNQDFENFDLEKSQDGCIWLTKDLLSIKNGETGASLNSEKVFIHECFIKGCKFGSWDENDKYMDDQLIQQGYDGLYLDEDVKMYNADNIKKITSDFIIEKKNKPRRKQKPF